MEGMVWLAIVVVMAIIEIITLGLTSIWFAGGALAAFVAYLLGAGLPVQIAVFVVVSLVLLAFTRPFAMKFINKDRTKTNVDSLIGREAVILEEVNNLKAQGLASVNGQEWSARSVDDRVIPRNTVVEITGISGVKLIVKTKEE